MIPWAAANQRGKAFQTLVRKWRDAAPSTKYSLPHLGFVFIFSVVSNVDVKLIFLHSVWAATTQQELLPLVPVETHQVILFSLAISR